MVRAREIKGMDGTMSFAEAAAVAIRTRAEEVFSFADGVLDISDPERVHDMRVATRRLRAALEIFAPCLRKREYKPLLREVKALADALGERRDPDVQIESLERLSALLDDDERAGVEALTDELRANRQHGNERVEQALERVRDCRLAERLDLLAAGALER
ncbi:MAG TPA: CHAD domain-containing protein [Thermoleophilaceae bacterium]|nr:CHAD domain-containing protein [Thermoleophilaceae bacterium]